VGRRRAAAADVKNPSGLRPEALSRKSFSLSCSRKAMMLR
jgi:hypothetical protein